MTISAKDLQPLIAAWLPTRRWFAGKGRDFVIAPRELVAVGAGPPEFAIWLAEVTFTGGASQLYQLPLAFHAEPVSAMEHVLIGTVPTDDGPRLVYDALYDHDFTQTYLTGLRDERNAGPLRFERFVDVADLPLNATSMVLTGEQSNTSLIFGDQAILKVYRRLEYGLNPDIEVQSALGKLGARHVARMLGAVTADIDAEPVSLAMMQEFMSSGTDGWELSKASVRDLMAEADLHAAEAGGDFASESHRLGVAVAQVHTDLARAFGTGELAAVDRLTRAGHMHQQLDRALTIVPDLAPVEAGLRHAFDEFATATMSLPTQRIHGDLHLGQALRTFHRWVLLDFEGEPARSIAERRAFDSPLRDVAGMLRSYDYAARYPILATPSSPQLEYRAMEWAERNRDAFCAGYAEGAGRDPHEDAAAIRGFEADKAVYEAIYEARNRPRWLSVPLASLTRLVSVGAGHVHPEAGP